MLISLFTSRIILQVLGVNDYGVYNVVAGAIGMFSILTSSLSSAISRFITFGIGKGEAGRLKTIFSTSLNVQIFLAVLILILTEAIGPWLINDKLNIPKDSIYAAHWVLQFSIAGFILGLIGVPYNACIIAHERMNVFAYMGILEVGLKLAFVASLYFIPGNKLIIYSICLFVIPLTLQLIYWTYCTRHFKECRYRFVFDKSLLKEIGGYAWWAFFGNATYMFNTQGINILMNLFFGVALNAARGIVSQVESAVMQFVNNFSTAINPQITKSYASGDLQYLYTLICRGAKFSIFLLLFFLIPLEFEAPFVLKLWLGVVPENASVFLRLSLVASAVILLGNTGLVSIFATGNIKKYQITMTLFSGLVFPFTWIAYKLGAPALTSYIIFIIIYAIIDVIRLIFMKNMLNFPIAMFINRAVIPIFYVATLAIIIPGVIYCLMSESILRLILICITSLINTASIIYFIGLGKGERAFVTNKIKSKLQHH